MDQKTSDNQVSRKNLDQVDPGNNENSSNNVDGVVLETVTAMDIGGTASISGENGNLESKSNELETEKVLQEVPKTEINQERHDGQRYGDALNEFDQGSSENSNNLVDGVRHETVIIDSDETVRVGENRESVAQVNNELGSSKAMVEKSKTKVADTGKESCVIDIKCGGVFGGCKQNCDGERVCRICHLNTEASSETIAAATGIVTMDLVQLGCHCKDELGIAHIHCAEAWFKLKGNRMCEICGQSAVNITGVGDSTFMEEWNGQRFTSSSIRSSERVTNCWRGQPFCNFLMACLVIAFVLPWFFRVNMF
ncbi:RINGv domain-containing protein [Cephalotus follicularis]|uniref:RINGv domain-containing protein n=1 Tax=Cephalotus follicularis TaxID=3775 RepID=A0A1Q3APB7_CEPFO|nr:RINGv domain-containing protein [Cephalotus follicularis]